MLGGYYSSFVDMCNYTNVCNSVIHLYMNKCTLTLFIRLNEGGSFNWCVHRPGNIQKNSEEGMGTCPSLALLY